MAFVVRAARMTDFPFIFSTWLKSYYNSSTFAKNIKPAEYFKFHHALLENLITRPGVLSLVAVNPSDDNQIYGWAVLEQSVVGSVVHYCYTKPVFRRLGCAKAMLPAREAKVYASHLSYIGAKLLPATWAYCPYLIS